MCRAARREKERLKRMGLCAEWNCMHLRRAGAKMGKGQGAGTAATHLALRPLTMAPALEMMILHRRV